MAWRIRRTSWCCRNDTGRYAAVSCFNRIMNILLNSLRIDGAAPQSQAQKTRATGQGQLGPKARSKMKIIEGSVAQASSLAPDICTPSKRQFWELCHQVGGMSTLQPQISPRLSKEEASQSQPETAETGPELLSSWDCWESGMSKINHGVKH